MYKDVPIYLSGTNQEKGTCFEALMKMALDLLGYGKLAVNVRTTGTELDVTGEHKVTGQPIVVECKGRQKRANSGDLKKFFGVFTKASGRNVSTFGLFVSLRGYDGPATAWHAELVEDHKKRFALWTGADLLTYLHDRNLLAARDTALALGSAALAGPNLDAVICLAAGSMYWAVTGYNPDDRRVCTMLDGRGQPVARTTAMAIVAGVSDLNKHIVIDPQANTVILRHLLDADWVSLDHLANAAAIDLAEAEWHCKNYDSRDVVQRRDNHGTPEVRLTADASRIRDAVYAFLIAGLGDTFLASDYAAQRLTVEYVQRLASRFGVVVAEPDAESLRRLILISPGALRYLHDPLTQPQQTVLDEIDKLQKQGEAATAEKMRAGQVSSLVGELVALAHMDLRLSANRATIESNGIRLIKANIALDFGRDRERFVSIKGGTEMVTMAIAPGAAVRAGQPLYFPPQALIQLGDMEIGLDNFDRAAEEYGQALNGDLSQQERAAASNNLGICRLRSALALGTPQAVATQRQALLEAACDAFRASAECDHVLVEPRRNLAEALRELGDMPGARAAAQDALSVDLSNEATLHLLADLLPANQSA